MADGIKATWRRKDKLYEKLRRLAPETDAELVKVNGEAAAEIVALAKSFVKVRTGALRDSIVATAPGGTPPAYAQGAVPAGAWMVTAGNSKVRYPHLVEYGAKPHKAGGQFEGADHPGAPAQPYFWPAARIVKKKQKGRASRAVTKAAKKVAGS